MPKCSVIKSKHKRINIGDMDKVIQLMNRDIQAPDDVDYDEDFTNKSDVWALIETVTGVTKFDKTNTEQVITHYFYIYYDASITSETWIRFDERNFNIVAPENFGERNEFMKIPVYETGDYKQKVNYA